MIVLLGALLAGGVLLMLAPRLWPVGSSGEPRRVAPRMAGLLAAAGYPRARVRTVVAAAVAAALLAAAVTWLVVPLPVLAVLAGATGAVAPFLWLRARRRRLIARRRMLWPDVCELLIAGVRSGLSLPDAVASLGDSGPAALRPAFARFGADLAASGHFDAGIVRMKAELADPVADRIIETLRMARQVGGAELVVVLRSLASAVRADAAVRAEVASRQSWTRNAAVLGVVAPWVVLALLALRPEGRAAYSSPEGTLVVIGGAVVSVIAYRLMSRIGRLREPRRWFG